MKGWSPFTQKPEVEKKKKDFDFGNLHEARAHSTSVKKPIIDSTSIEQLMDMKVAKHPDIYPQTTEFAKDFFSKKQKGK